MREKISIRVLVSGKVQGVGYRMATRRRAREWRVNGWVRNLSDGRVEAVFEGEEAALAEMLKWCRSGPPAAVVADVTVDRLEPLEIEGFTVRS